MNAMADKIYNELKKKKIDWDSLEIFISGLGESINMYVDEETLLSEAYMSHRKDGRVNIRLTELFLKYGFDVNANDRKNGASCLRALCWSTYDKYILNVAEMLLDIGADSTIGCKEDEDEDEKGVLGNISWKLGYWMIGEYEDANLFEAYYEMVYRAQNGKKYAGIRAFRDSVGEVVSKVEKLKVHSYDRDSHRISYLLHCGEKHLVVSDSSELIISPYEREEAIDVEDVSEEYLCLIGSKIKGLRYLNNSLAKLNFDNGLSILVGFDCPKGTNERSSLFKITPSVQAKLPELGTCIKAIKLWGNITHADNSTFYKEHTIVVNTENEAYALYSHKTKYSKSLVRVQMLGTDVAAKISRGIDVHNLILKYIEYAGDSIQWISFNCDEGVLYVVTDNFENVALFLSDKELEEKDIHYANFGTKRLKKIKFIYGGCKKQ